VVIKFKYISHETVVEIVGRDWEKLNELQADVNGYMLAEVIWRSRNVHILSMINTR
jgi:hypothetical protein